MGYWSPTPVAIRAISFFRFYRSGRRAPETHREGSPGRVLLTFLAPQAAFLCRTSCVWLCHSFSEAFREPSPVANSLPSVVTVGNTPLSPMSAPPLHLHHTARQASPQLTWGLLATSWSPDLKPPHSNPSSTEPWSQRAAPAPGLSALLLKTLVVPGGLQGRTAAAQHSSGALWHVDPACLSRISSWPHIHMVPQPPNGMPFLCYSPPHLEWLTPTVSESTPSKDPAWYLPRPAQALAGYHAHARPCTQTLC